MAYIHFTENLFLETLELERLQAFATELGWQKVLKSITLSPGIVKTNSGQFTQGRVTQTLNTLRGLDVAPFLAIDQEGKLVTLDSIYNAITVPNDNQWYWVRTKHAYSTNEIGTFDIDDEGVLTLTSGNVDLQKILRGQPNFNTLVRFTNAQKNVEEYDVADVINSTTAVLAGNFLPETGLKMELVGTFTPNIVIADGEKRPFRFDSASITLVQESTYNVRPAYQQGFEFDLARVKVIDNQLVIQDRRDELFQLNSESPFLVPNTFNNQLIGVDSVRWASKESGAYTSYINLNWSITSVSFSVNTTTNQITLNSAIGGKVKAITDIATGQLDGWLCYTEDGKYSKITKSIKQGSSIVLNLERVAIDSYSTDGGLTFTGQKLTITPPYTDIEIYCSTDAAYQGKPEAITTHSFPIVKGNASIPVVTYSDTQPTYYIVQVRYRNHLRATTWTALPTDTNQGFLTEDSYTVDGILKPIDEQKRTPYVGSSTVGYIACSPNPRGLQAFRSAIEKNAPGVTYVAFPLSSNIYTVRSGISTVNQIIRGNSLATAYTQLFINLDTTDAVPGSQFIFTIAEDAVLSDTTVVGIYQNYIKPSAPGKLLKSITLSDISEARNATNAIAITFTYDGANWSITNSYTLEGKGTIKMFSGIVEDSFDGSGMGKVKGWYGWCLCNGQNNTPNIGDRFPTGYNPGLNKVGELGGQNTVILTPENIPPHQHVFYYQTRDDIARDNTGAGVVRDLKSPGGTNITNNVLTGVNDTITKPLDNRPSYVVLAFAMKLY